MCFLFEIPSFEELQDPNSSPGREEVGRRTLGAIGGFLLSFFYRDRFQTGELDSNSLIPHFYLLSLLSPTSRGEPGTRIPR